MEAPAIITAYSEAFGVIDACRADDHALTTQLIRESDDLPVLAAALGYLAAVAVDALGYPPEMWQKARAAIGA